MAMNKPVHTILDGAYRQEAWISRIPYELGHLRGFYQRNIIREITQWDVPVIRPLLGLQL
jgi:hypothetical protein